MESTKYPNESNKPIQVDPVIRWDIYYRLLELSIPCSCETGEPLRVNIQDTLAAIQLWSVMKQTTAPRDEQVEWLNACWGV
jgi:hypothetical protein